MGCHTLTEKLGVVVNASWALSRHVAVQGGVAEEIALVVERRATVAF